MIVPKNDELRRKIALLKNKDGSMFFINDDWTPSFYYDIKRFEDVAPDLSELLIAIENKWTEINFNLDIIYEGYKESKSGLGNTIEERFLNAVLTAALEDGAVEYENN